MKTDELINPFGTSRPGKVFAALQEGPKTTDELVKMQTVKRHRRVQDMAVIINLTSGVRVKFTGDKPEDPDTVWTLTITDPKTPLIPKVITQKTGATIQAVPFNPNTPTKMGQYLPPPEYGFIRTSVEEGNNIFLVGPTGSGKTEMGGHLAKDTKRVFLRQNFNGETTVENLIGSTKIRNDNGTAITEWQDGVLAEACRRAARGEKILYLADEVTAGKPEVIFQFNRVLEIRADGSRTIEIEGEQIEIPAGNLTIMCASNSFRSDETGLYQGTNAMNLSFANRFTGGVFFIDYAPNEDEILEGYGIDERLARALRSMAMKVRAQSQKEGYPVVCSTRELIAVGKKAKTWGVLKALEFCYLNKLTADERQRVVDPVIMGMAWPK